VIVGTYFSESIGVLFASIVSSDVQLWLHIRGIKRRYEEHVMNSVEKVYSKVC